MSETKTDAKYLDQARRIAAGNDLFDGCRSTPEEIREIAERLQREANQEQPMTDAKLAEIRARHELSCGERKHGPGECFALTPGECLVCDADNAAIDDRATLLSHLAAAQAQQAAQAADFQTVLGDLQRMLQPGGSPPPYPPLHFALWIIREAAKKQDELITALAASQSRAERAEGELTKMREVLSDIPSWLIGKASAFAYLSSAGVDLEDLPDNAAEVQGWLNRRREVLNPTPAATEGE